jgi:hypothetical protein
MLVNTVQIRKTQQKPVSSTLFPVPMKILGESGASDNEHSGKTIVYSCSFTNSYFTKEAADASWSTLEKFPNERGCCSCIRDLSGNLWMCMA